MVVYVLAIILAILAFAFGVLAYTSPESVINGYKAGSGASADAAREFAAVRTMALGLTFVAGVLSRNRMALALAFFSRAATEFQDVLIPLSKGNVGTAFVALVFLAVEIYCVWALMQKPKEEMVKA